MTQPNTIATRFAEKFASAYLVGDADVVDALLKDILAFFQAEVLAIAEKVDLMPRHKEESDDFALRAAATLIRNKANEIV